MLALGSLIVCCQWCCAQNQGESKKEGQINVNWLYGSYVPKDVPLESLSTDRRFQLYLRQTYTTWGIYIKTTLFAVRDQSHNTYPEWGQSFSGFAKRWGTRQGQFIVQNSVSSFGNGLLGWEPRYDRCRCSGLWPRTRHAIVRNFVTYDRTEKSLRPQLFPYVGAFAGAVISTTWQPDTIAKESSAKLDGAGFCCDAAGFTPCKSRLLLRKLRKVSRDTEQKPVKVGERRRTSSWKTSTRNLRQYNHRQGDTSRDTSSIDVGQLALPNSARPGGTTWQTTPLAGRGSNCDSARSIC